MLTDSALLALLQWASPALPIGGFNYSEGLETLIAQGKITSAAALQDWLSFELAFGSAHLETVVMVRVYRAIAKGDFDAVHQWNAWLSAARESAELRAQNWQMGTALINLVAALGRLPPELQTGQPYPWNTSVAFCIAAALADIPLENALLGYLHSWVTTLINATVKLIPLGQTAGQVLLCQLQPQIQQTVQQSLNVTDHHLDDNLNLESCTLGLALASMQHETLYCRLFRS
ncbi:urease accessory protein UreF [Thermosynechococcus sp. NK55a]|jgi:urease accessory protein|uniref:urease accessory protein UreF n=1 Tax=Thermosynechococcus sp. NK55a TaxID=1394889 RepID=UPI0003D7EF93|nr:urease accessory protein UreF [Thermosynechococcus sp. NK55a]AHB87818.1 urease accessory protein UreF [Thermosynechococcus sp. NK55a]RMH64025.1 MAG: urease accessory protein UreF [Cyanobacteria bacterium J003]